MPGKKLLVADDSLTIQKVIRLALSNEGYEIQAVSDGNDAIQQISLFRPDVVLIDVSLPGKTAFEVKREINQHDDLEEIRFVLMSSAFENVDEPQAEEVTFHGRLTKPFDPAHLRQVLTDVLAQVSARRSEKTSILQRPQPEAPAPKPPIDSEKLSFFPPSSESSPISSPRDLLLPDEMPDTENEPGAFQESLDPPPSFPPPSFPGPQESSEHLDQWEETIQPNLPMVPTPPPQETLGTLWEPGDDPTNPGIQAPPSQPLPPRSMPGSIEGEPTFSESMPDFMRSPPSAPPSLAPDISGETDIKQLTESTMRMNSGMEDFQWSVNEPMLKPLPKILDRSGSNFELDESHIHTVPPPRENRPPPMPDTLKTIDLPPPPGLPTMDEMTFPSMNQAMNQSTPPPIKKEHTAPVSNPAPMEGAQVIAISQEQIEELIRNEVQAAFTKMAQKILPEVAEKVIKQEINRMLSEQ